MSAKIVPCQVVTVVSRTTPNNVIFALILMPISKGGNAVVLQENSFQLMGSAQHVRFLDV